MAYIGAGITRFNTADELTVTGTSEFGGNVSFGDNNITNVGSLQIDSIAGDADTNTNITFAGSDVITMTTAGSERLRLDASGNVGVGTASPSERVTIGANSSDTALSGTSNTQGLHLYARSFGIAQIDSLVSSSNNSGMSLRTYNNGTYTAFIENLQGNTTTFATAGSERMRIDSGGNVGIGNSTPGNFYTGANQLVVGDGSGDNGISLYGGTSGVNRIYFADGSSGAARYDGYIEYSHSNRRMLFGTAANTRMTIDSNGNLGIGTTSPNAPAAIVARTTSYEGLELVTPTGDGSGEFHIGVHQNGSTAGRSIVFKRGGTDGMDTESARIDASGNLLVGKTSSDAGVTAGLEYHEAFGVLYVTDSGGESAVFNRLSSDGDIVRFRKDGTTVGSIGTSTNTEITFAGLDAGVGIIDHAVVPTQGDGVLYRNDNEVDLGRSDTRFKDLYLSGGAYIGGTGSANKLDDYEEGVHAVTISATGSGTPTISSGEDTLSYVKIGQIVHISGQLGSINCSGCTGELRVTMPFTSASLSERADYYTLNVPKGDAGASVSHFYLSNTGGSSAFQVIAVKTDASTDGNVATLMASEGTFDLNINGTYRTT